MKVLGMVIILTHQLLWPAPISYTSILAADKWASTFQGQQALNYSHICKICRFYICQMRLFCLSVFILVTKSTVHTRSRGIVFENIQNQGWCRAVSNKPTHLKENSHTLSKPVFAMESFLGSFYRVWDQPVKNNFSRCSWWSKRKRSYRRYRFPSLIR